jgi:hypothetical protein
MKIAGHSYVIEKLALTVMLLHYFGTARAAQLTALLEIGAEIYDSRRNMLVEINRMDFQFSDFEEHFGPPHPNWYRAGRGSATEGVSTPASYS